VDAHVAAHAVGVLAELALHLFQAEQHRAGMMQEAFAGGGQVHAAGVPIEKGRVECGFEVAQAFADGGRGNELPLGGLADAAQFADRDEKLQRGQINAAGKVAFGDLHGVKVFSFREDFGFSFIYCLSDIVNRDGSDAEARAQRTGYGIARTRWDAGAGGLGCFRFRAPGPGEFLINFGAIPAPMGHQMLHKK
jgi:hypothetical protein